MLAVWFRFSVSADPLEGRDAPEPVPFAAPLSGAVFPVQFPFSA